MCVCVCVRVCVRACVLSDITLSTAEMGFLESVFGRPVSSNIITLFQLQSDVTPDDQLLTCCVLQTRPLRAPIY